MNYKVMGYEFDRELGNMAGVEGGRGKSKSDTNTASIQKLIKEIKFK